MFLELAADKVAMESDFDWLADERIDRFRQTLETELRPVLRAEAYQAFDLKRALKTLHQIEKAIREKLAHRHV